MKDLNSSDLDDNITELSTLIDPTTQQHADPVHSVVLATLEASESNSAKMAPNADSEVGSTSTSSVSSSNHTESGQVGTDDSQSSEEKTAEMITKGSSEKTAELGAASATELPDESLNETKAENSSNRNEPVEASKLPVVTGLDIAEDSVSRISSIQGDMCRICHCVTDDSEALISPCDCRGSMKWVHQKCLQRWVKSRDAKKCELCSYQFNMTSSVKPFRKWKKLNMSSVERRRVLCSVTFHVVAITCVIWSLYVLIDRTTQEIQAGNLNWPFWTKLVVVAIGFTGGLVFMYVQCKTYVKLFRRWKQFNRVIYINDIQLPESDDVEDTNPTVTVEITPGSQQDDTVVVATQQSENPV